MKFLATLILLFSAVSSVAAIQSDDEKLTPNEEQEIKSFVKQFAATIKKTRDLTPFVNTTPASDLMDKVLHDPNDSVGLIDYTLGSRVGRYQLRRFNIAMLNLGYLSELYVYTRFLVKETPIRDLRPAQQYPPNVIRTMKRNALINKWWATKDLDDSDAVLTTVAQFRSMLRTFEQAAALMRVYFRNHPPEQAAVYKRNLIDLEPFLKEIAVERCSTEQSCAGLPLHTQEIKLKLHVLDLSLVRLNGQLKFLMIGVGHD